MLQIAHILYMTMLHWDKNVLRWMLCNYCRRHHTSFSFNNSQQWCQTQNASYLLLKYRTGLGQEETSQSYSFIFLSPWWIWCRLGPSNNPSWCRTHVSPYRLSFFRFLRNNNNTKKKKKSQSYQYYELSWYFGCKNINTSGILLLMRLTVCLEPK